MRPRQSERHISEHIFKFISFQQNFVFIQSCYLFLTVKLAISQHWFGMNQWCPCTMVHVCVTRPDELTHLPLDRFRRRHFQMHFSDRKNVSFQFQWSFFLMVKLTIHRLSQQFHSQPSYENFIEPGRCKEENRLFSFRTQFILWLLLVGSWGWWFETPHSLWRLCSVHISTVLQWNVSILKIFIYHTENCSNKIFIYHTGNCSNHVTENRVIMIPTLSSLTAP